MFGGNFRDFGRYLKYFLTCDQGLVKPLFLRAALIHIGSNQQLSAEKEN